MAEDTQWQIGVAGAVIHEVRVLLVRHTYGEKQSRWAIPGGFATHHERLDQAVVREVREEASIDAEVVDVIAVSTQVTAQGGSIHVIFRLRPLAGEPVPDNREVDRAAYFSAGEIMAMTDQELLPISRNVALAALQDATGLVEDIHFSEKSETHRGFLIRGE